MNDPSTIEILLVEDNPGDARLVREALRDADATASSATFRLRVVERLQPALEMLGRESIDVVLLDLSLPDSDGYATFQKVQAAAATNCAVVVLTRTDDVSLGTRAVSEGAQDYLTKAQFDESSLTRSLRHARDRKRAEMARLDIARVEAARAEAAAHGTMLQALFDSAQDAILISDDEGRYLDANGSAMSLLQRSREEILKMAFADLPPGHAAETREAWAQFLRDGEQSGELTIQRPDGTSRVVEFRAKAHIQRGQHMSVMRDITDRKTGETERAGLHARERTARVEADLLARAGTALASTLESEGIVERFVSLVIPEVADWVCVYGDDEVAPARLIAAAHTDPAMSSALAKAFPQPGSAPDDLPPALVACATMRVPLASAGRTFGLLVLAASTSGRHYSSEDVRLAEELGRRLAAALEGARLFDLARRERTRAEQANRAQDEFLGVVSHELRSPLNAILGWTRLVRTGKLSGAEVDRALETIERNAVAQAKLIEDILDTSRITTGKLRLELQRTEIGAVAEAAADVVRPSADAKGVALRVLIDADVGAAQVDASRLQQIIWNLLANAVKFTPTGGRVELGVSRDRDSVEIMVSDTGAGIDPEFLPHVFDPFRQADSTVTRSNGGLGLGLSIVKHLVELHGGSVRATSDGRGRGSLFTVRLPVTLVRAPVDVAVDAVDASTPPRSYSCPPELAGLRVMVVDDELDARELVASVLGQCGILVELAGSAEEAMKLLALTRPELIICDIAMPIEDGYSFIARLRQRPPQSGGETPAIALTAHVRLEDRTRALRAGFTNHVGKPVDPTELFAVIVAATGRRAAPAIQP